MKANSIAVTDARVHRALDNKINQVIDKRNIPAMITKAVTDAKIHTGVVVKYYHYKDQALVRFTDNTYVLCGLLHQMNGNLIDFFTPEGELKFCEDLQEPYIQPRAELHVMVADINNGDDTQLILGYYNPNDITYTAPAEQGHFKITNINATNEFGVDIGNGKVTIKSIEGVSFTEGLFPEDETDVVYANSDDVPLARDVYTKNEVYTKAQVDKLIEDLREEILGDSDDSN